MDIVQKWVNVIKTKLSFFLKNGQTGTLTCKKTLPKKSHTLRDFWAKVPFCGVYPTFSSHTLRVFTLWANVCVTIVAFEVIVKTCLLNSIKRHQKTLNLNNTGIFEKFIEKLI